MVKLGEIATVERRGVQPDQFPANTVYLGLEHIEKGGRILEYAAAIEEGLRSTKFQFTSNHVLYGKLRPYLAKIALPDREGICSTDILPVLPGPELDRTYLAYYLRQGSLVDFAASRASGANLPRLSARQLEQFPVPVPPLDEQRRIAAILDRADAIRTKRRETLTQLDLCPSAIYRQTVAPDTPIIRLGDIAQVKGGKRLPKGVSYSDQRTAHAYIRVSDFRDGYISDEDMPFLDTATFEKLKRYTVEASDVLISIAGSIGIIATIPKHLVGANLTENAARVTPRSNAEAWHPEWVRMSLLSPGAQAQIRRATGQVTIGKLALFRIEDLQIPLPSVSVQQRFVKRLNAVAELRRKIQMDLEHLDYLFASLQSRAFKGEL